jgi:hypothetical protein
LENEAFQTLSAIILFCFVLGISFIQATVLKAHENKPCEDSCQGINITYLTQKNKNKT